MSESARILFLCTANYYRSRFAEYFFNHLAEQAGLAVRADSAGIEMAKWRDFNPGELSMHSVSALKDLGVQLPEPYRAPRQFEPDSVPQSVRLIALSEQEHRPMLQRLYPAVLDRVEFWTVEDVEFESPEQALRRIREYVTRCLEDYR